MSTNKYMIETLLFSSYVVFGMCWSGGSAFIPQIMQELNIRELAAGSNITNAVSAAKILGTLIAAGILSRLLVKKSVTLAMGLMALGVFTPLVHNYQLLLLLRFLMGLGGALIIVYFSPIVMQWFPERERPFVNGLNSVAFNVGAAIIVFFLPDLLGWFGDWKQTLFCISLGSVACLLLWLRFGADADPRLPQHDPDAARYRLRDGLKERFNWLYALTYSGTLSFYVVLFSFYKNAGISQAKYVILAGIFGTVAGIVLARRLQRRLPLLRLSGLLQLLAITGLHAKAWGLTQSDTLVTTCAVLAGFFVFLPMTSLISLGQEQAGMTPRKAAVTFSLFWCLSYLLASVVPFVFAHLVDLNHGDYASAFVFITLVSSSFLIGSCLLPEGRRATV